MGKPILSYVVNYWLDVWLQSVLLHVANILIDLYLAKPDSSNEVKALFKQLESKLEKKMLCDKELAKLQGCIDMILDTADTAASTNTRIEKDLLNLKKS